MEKELKYLNTVEELEALYDTPGAPSLRKVAHRLTPEYRRWIEASKFCVVSTVGPDGTDGSPRGDTAPVVQVLDEKTLALPDWRGNNRIDTLRNIIVDSRLSLMFMVAGSTNVVRVNGHGKITADEELRNRFAHISKTPRTVIVIKIDEIYSQCARAILRANLWGGQDESHGLPTVGEILASLTDGEEGGAAYDGSWAQRAAKTMW